MQASGWKSPLWAVVAALGLVAGCAEMLTRPEDLKDPIGQRRTLMKGNAQNLRAIKGLLDAGKVEQVSSHARAMVATAAAIPVRFKEKALSAQSLAKPEIWDKWTEFTARAAALGVNARNLDEAAGKGDLAAAKAAFAQIGRSCGACHNGFRKPPAR